MNKWIRLHLDAEELSFFKAIPAVVWQLLFFCIPLLFVISLSFYDPEQGTLSGHHYTTLLALPYVYVLIRSLLLASATTFFCLVLGYPLAYYIALKKRAW